MAASLPRRISSQRPTGIGSTGRSGVEGAPAFLKTGLGAYVVGLLVSVPFMNLSSYGLKYVGPVASLIGGADVSFFVGAVAAFVVWFVVLLPFVLHDREPVQFAGIAVPYGLIVAVVLCLKAFAIVTLMLAALSVSAAIFLILELDSPFNGVIQISSGPMRNALAHLGR